MDLRDKITDAINAGLDLPTPLLEGYMTGQNTPELRIYDLPSSVISEDFAGNKVEQFIFEIAMRDDDEARATATLWDIVKLITSDAFSVVSGDSSFKFNTLEMATFPRPTSADTKGNVVYTLDFKITADHYTTND